MRPYVQTDDPEQTLRRAEFYAWQGLLHAMEMVSDLPPNAGDLLRHRRAQCERAKATWAQALRALDGRS